MIEMDLSGVRHIQARIAAIQDKFGIPGGVPGMDFDSVLPRRQRRQVLLMPPRRASLPAR